MDITIFESNIKLSALEAMEVPSSDPRHLQRGAMGAHSSDSRYLRRGASHCPMQWFNQWKFNQVMYAICSWLLGCLTSTEQHGLRPVAAPPVDRDIAATFATHCNDMPHRFRNGIGASQHLLGMLATVSTVPIWTQWPMMACQS